LSTLPTIFFALNPQAFHYFLTFTALILDDNARRERLVASPKKNSRFSAGSILTKTAVQVDV